MPRPGDVWFLPPEAHPDGDPKPRRHVLLTPVDDADDVCALAFASRSATEGAFGGAFVRVEPRTGGEPNGFVATTFVAPCRLVSAYATDLLRRCGRLSREMPAVRGGVRQALGFGTGTRRNGGWRGCVVRLSPLMAAETGFAEAVVVTEPGYARRRRFQIVVPVLPWGGFAADAFDVPAVLSSRTSRGRPRRVVLGARLVQSVFHARDIAGPTGEVVPHAAMGALERSLAALLRLDDPSV